MGSESLDDVGTILRSILTSEKTGIPLRKLEGEYRTLTGDRIPYRKFGFNTLEEYLRSIPDTVHLARNFNGETLVHVVVTESTAHVAQMVRGQKSTKPRPAARTTYRRPVTQHQSAYRPNRILSKYSSTHKPSPSAAGDKRRAGYEIYHPPAQRTNQPFHARQQPSAFGWAKKESSPMLRNNEGDRSEKKPSSFSAFASGFQRPSFEKPPRFLKAAQRSSSSSSISSLSNDEGGAKVQQPAAAAPVATKGFGAAAPKDHPQENSGWRQLDSSWSQSAPSTTASSGASRAAQPAATGGGGGGDWNGGGGGSTGTSSAQRWGAASKKPATDTEITTAGDTGWRDERVATDGWGEPAQPIATSTAVKSLGWNDSKPVESPTPAVGPLLTSAKPATLTERQPVGIEPGQQRFDPFRSLTLTGQKVAWMEPAQQRFDPFRSATPTGQVNLDLSASPTLAEPKLAGIEPGQQRFDPFRSTTLMEPVTFASAAPKKQDAAGIEQRQQQRFDPFRQPLRLDSVPLTATVAKGALELNLASSMPATGPSVAPKSPSAATSNIPSTAPTLQPATMLAPLQQPPAVCDDKPAMLPLEEPCPMTPNCLLVQAYAQRRGLVYTFTTMEHRSKRGGPPMWLATLRLGDRKFPSYPDEKATPDEAIEAAAARAVTELHIETVPSARSVTPAKTPEEIATLVMRVAQVVLSKPNGILKEGMCAAYEERFDEQLPPLWLKHVAKSGLVLVESGHHCILYPPQPSNGPAFQRGRALSTDKDNLGEPAQNASDKKSSASNSLGEPPQSATDYVDVFVTCVTSTVNVCFRFVDYDAEYNQLLDNMADHYGSGDKAQVANNLEEGHLYATLHGDRWLRVQLGTRLENGKAECYFVDEGNNAVLEEAALMNLDAEFGLLPMQAIQCQLDGLVQHAECEGIVDILSEVLLGKSLVAEVISRVDPVTVVMFDTWGSEDVDLNSEIFQRLTRVRVPEKGCVGKTHLSHIRADGVVWLQMSGPGLDVLNDFMDAVNKFCRNNPAMEEEPVMDKVYACQYRVDGIFYRAVLSSPNPLPSGAFEVLFIDYGNEATAFLADFRNIDCLGDLVVRLPRQGLKGRLRGVTEADGITWSGNATTKLLDLVGIGTQLLVRVAEPASYMEPALVELFKRHEESRDLISINDTLAELLRHDPPPLLQY